MATEPLILTTHCMHFISIYTSQFHFLANIRKVRNILVITMALNILLFFISLSSVATLNVHGLSTDSDRKAYIVYMGEANGDAQSIHQQHHNLLVAAIGDEATARDSKIHSYGRSFNGFVARLLPHEVRRLADEDVVVSVFENTRNKLHTTRSWDFIGMTEKVVRRHQMESDIIVAVLDTGIYINAPSFNDDGYGPTPSKWKGKCVKAGNFTGCNKKVIGAKYYNLDNAADPDMGELSPIDNDGHGTHTSSTAAGISVKGASFYGIAGGTARGGVPSARISMYKVCWGSGCTDMDMLAAFDDAIADGVDVISVSIGGSPRKYFEDPMAIGSFHALKKGILTSCSAGNDGPYPQTVQNTAPWIMTVGATGIDRKFETAVKLGNGMKATGMSINTVEQKKMYPLISGALATNLTGNYYGNASACDYGTLSMEKVKGKIVYCLGSNNQDYVIKELKGVGVIMSAEEETDLAFTTVIPGINVAVKDGYKMDKYINTTKNPMAVISKTTTAKQAAPFIASFSSRGPQSLSPNILKPDLSAPGLDILAAYSKLVSVTGDTSDDRYSIFNIISGTSMSCPHAAGAAAYVKSFHPDWSASAIKSALMTTATPMKIDDVDGALGTGSGQINPRKAVHPGLIYDISMSSYIGFLCKEGYNGTTIGLIVGTKKKFDCANFKPAKGTDGINYPTMHTQLQLPNANISAEFHRTVTHVAYGKSVYKAIVKSDQGLSIKVVPDTLTFNKPHQKQDFKVIVNGSPMKENIRMLSGLLEWKDSKHSVKSPIVIYRQVL